MINQTSSPLSETPPIENMAYEQACAELEMILGSLETNKHSLEEALALYERGQILVKHCLYLLDRAELKIQQLSGEELIPFSNPQAAS